MLQIYIEHYKNETVSIESISNDDTVLADFENGKIDLDVCIPYINQRIKVHHRYSDNPKENYTLTAILEAVEIEPVTQVKCIKFSVIS